MSSRALARHFGALAASHDALDNFTGRLATHSDGTKSLGARLCRGPRRRREGHRCRKGQVNAALELNSSVARSASRRLAPAGAAPVPPIEGQAFFGEK
jgi:hypothetical protein